MSFGASLDKIVLENRNGLLSIGPGWTRKKLSDVATVLNGFAFKSAQFSEEGMPLIRIRDILSSATKTGYVGPYDEKYVVESGDLLLTTANNVVAPNVAFSPDGQQIAVADTGGDVNVWDL